MPDLPELTPVELDAFARLYGLQGPPERLPSVGSVNRIYAGTLNGAPVVLRVPLPGDHAAPLTGSAADLRRRAQRGERARDRVRLRAGPPATGA